MKEAIEALEDSILGWQRHAEYEEENIERNRNTIKFAEERIEASEAEIRRAEAHIEALLMGVDRLKNSVPPSEPIKRPAAEWCEITGIQIMDPDGWRHGMALAWTTPITRPDFIHRAMTSTCLMWPNPLLDERNGS